jgi:predicted sugar kinase
VEELTADHVRHEFVRVAADIEELELFCKRCAVRVLEARKVGRAVCYKLLESTVRREADAVGARLDQFESEGKIWLDVACGVRRWSMTPDIYLLSPQ